MGWATFWAIFLQTHLVNLTADKVTRWKKSSKTWPSPFFAKINT
jgi:hypothetical protein